MTVPFHAQGKKSSGGSKKRKSEAISEEEPAAEAADGDAMDMTAVNKLTADKLKKELKKRKLDDKGKKAELKARLDGMPEPERTPSTNSQIRLDYYGAVRALDTRVDVCAKCGLLLRC